MNLFIICLFFLQLSYSSYCSDEKKDKLDYYRIDLIRQKSPRKELRKHSTFMKKYGFDLDNSIYDKPPAPPRTNDTIPLFRTLDNEFYGVIIIGHPAQQFNVAFDTAWSISWIMSRLCKVNNVKGCAGHSVYDHGASSTYKKDGRPFSIPMGSSNLTGYYSYDNITLAHTNNTFQSFVELTYVPDDFVANKADGIIGLGLKYDSYNPYFYSLLQQKRIKDPIFSVFLNRDPSSKKGGSIILGFIDDKHIHKSVINNKVVRDNITYLPVTSKEYWQFKIDQIYLSSWRSEPENFTFCDNTCQGIADSNSNEILVPNEVAQQIHDSIRATYDKDSGEYLVDCDTIKVLPHINIELAGTNFTLLPVSYILKQTHGFKTQCASCFRGGANQDHWVLGGAFLAEYYSIYNVNENKIGFVRSASAR